MSSNFGLAPGKICSPRAGRNRNEPGVRIQKSSVGLHSLRVDGMRKRPSAEAGFIERCLPALRGVLGIDIGRRSVTGGAATPQRSLYVVPQPKAGTHVRGTLPRRHPRMAMARRIIEPLQRLSRRYFRSRWALLRGLIRLFLPFRSDGQDQPTQKRPFVFVFVSNKWRSQRRWYRHDRLSTRRVIDEPPPTAES